ncbi:cation:proton antiporter [Streptomyces echinatus]|uniref:Kef-type K+ transport system membrane component KefB n=1 Tax=Streptomyces echinatus TaxID=67293 RepID=A0A7W9UQI7_9ACTN|nr:cation:proton antiporter [Streptomyces echinatus]MBB5927453.1 Kef-type K+ transport system membrane component KefB [Streptomyces echinatus]
MTPSQTLSLFLDLALILGLARVLGVAARALGQPAVIGEILAGILLGPTLLGAHLSDALFPAEVRPLLSTLAGVGLALFMFTVGSEIDLGVLRGRGRVTGWATVLSTALPLALGAGLAWLLADAHRQGPLPAFVLFFAVAMAATAFPVLARIIADRGLTRTRIGTTALACAAMTDLLVWIMLAAVAAMATGKDLDWRLALLVPYVVLMIAVVRPLLRRASEASRRRKARGTGSPGHREDLNLVVLVLVGLLLSAACTEWMGLHYIFGAFLFGAVVPRDGGGTLSEGALQRMEPLSRLLLLPVYFALAGLKVDLSGLALADLGALAAILVAAMAGKFLGAYLGARLGGSGRRPAAALGALLNTRGLTELVVLGLGLELGLLDGTLYSLMVVMAVVTTALTGPLLNRILPTSGRSGTTAGTSAPADSGPGERPAREAVPGSRRATP